jgi:hypothetical protein
MQGGQTTAAREAKREALALRKAAAVEEQQRRYVSLSVCLLYHHLPTLLHDRNSGLLPDGTQCDIASR